MPPIPTSLARQLLDAAEELGATTMEFPGQEKPEPEKPLPEGPWNVKQAAKALGISERTVRDHIKSGRLKSHRAGTGRGAVRILPADVEAFQQGAAPEPKSARPLPRHW